MGQFDEARGRDRRAVAGWLFACCAVLALLVGVGGITRLTSSGLSIPNWRPVTGILPPIGEVAWERAFAEYRETPEFRIVNAAMTLDEFRGIFAWEYVHRLLARLFGLMFAAPLAIFAWRRRLPPGAGGPLVAVLAAVALQGAMGWFLVRSGLVAEPRVSPLRLAAHLGLAFLIFGAMLWLALGIGRPRLSRSARPGGLANRFAGALVVVIFAQVLGGALMAGTHAGYLFRPFRGWRASSSRRGSSPSTPGRAAWSMTWSRSTSSTADAASRSPCSLSPSSPRASRARPGAAGAARRSRSPGPPWRPLG